MRHSTIDLTMNTYTDPRVLDVAGALDSLPALSLNSGPLDGATQDRQLARATGTDDRRPAERAAEVSWRQRWRQIQVSRAN
ncbi:hypothetical protein K2D_35990 [Planctomycetes bacterium K2D]|uniref:Uncharacterized protein n=1 Tax=Botrimarina mediterranea TaxID=2528022 RepID=A0A518KBZ1_9BACT|nr:hypothetical protein Spa11_35240 [Botrimarina mediterranea]QDV79979.1 hypothetical protein K2D_35990 [Planctomycetes bacterium K2D]